MAGNMVKTDLVTEDIGDPGDAVKKPAAPSTRPPPSGRGALTRARGAFRTQVELFGECLWLGMSWEEPRP